jgi:dihydropteroate synthase
MAAEIRPLILPSEAEAELRMREMGHHGTSRSEALRLRKRSFKVHDLSLDEAKALFEAARALGGDLVLSIKGTEGVLVVADGQLKALATLLAGAPALAQTLEHFAERLTERGWRDGAGRPLAFADRTCIMGVLNITPDSFSDGGKFFDPILAEEQAERMVAEGADIIDVGGMTTRPGAAEIDALDEMARVLPVVGRLARKLRVPVSIDTYRADVAEKALDAGASIVNDVSGFTFDARLAGVCARKNAAVVLMHTPAKPAVMMAHTEYRDLVRDVRKALELARERALAAGIAAERIAVDPGFGFGKTADQGWELLRRLREFQGLGAALLVGVSRKSMFREITGDAAPAARDAASAAAAAAAVLAGADIVRVHNVAMNRDAVRVADRLARAPRL